MRETAPRPRAPLPEVWAQLAVAGRGMSVRDERRAPWAWVTISALRTIRSRVAVTRQAGARNALLSLSEAASNRRDGHHREGDTLRTVAALAGMSERRLRDHMRELADIGLIEIRGSHDGAGRDLPKVYVLKDGPDESSGRSDGTADDSPDESSGPNARAGSRGRRRSEEPPSPPRGDRLRDRQRFKEQCEAYAQRHFPELAAGADAVRQAVTYGKASSLDQVTAFIGEHFTAGAA